MTRCEGEAATEARRAFDGAAPALVGAFVVHLPLHAVAEVGTGCGDGAGRADTPVDTPLVAPRIIAGTGLSSFVPITDDDRVEIIAGPQGRWHVDLGARVEGVPAVGLLRYRLFDERGTVVSRAAEYAIDPGRVIPDGVARFRLGDRAVLNVSAPDELSGRTVTLEVRFTTQLGRVIETRVRIGLCGARVTGVGPRGRLAAFAVSLTLGACGAAMASDSAGQDGGASGPRAGSPRAAPRGDHGRRHGQGRPCRRFWCRAASHGAPIRGAPPPGIGHLRRPPCARAQPRGTGHERFGGELSSGYRGRSSRQLGA